MNQQIFLHFYVCTFFQIIIAIFIIYFLQPTLLSFALPNLICISYFLYQSRNEPIQVAKSDRNDAFSFAFDSAHVVSSHFDLHNHVHFIQSKLCPNHFDRLFHRLGRSSRCSNAVPRPVCPGPTMIIVVVSVHLPSPASYSYGNIFLSRPTVSSIMSSSFRSTVQCTFLFVPQLWPCSSSSSSFFFSFLFRPILSSSCNIRRRLLIVLFVFRVLHQIFGSICWRHLILPRANQSPSSISYSSFYFTFFFAFLASIGIVLDYYMYIF